MNREIVDEGFKSLHRLEGDWEWLSPGDRLQDGDLNWLNYWHTFDRRRPIKPEDVGYEIAADEERCFMRRRKT